MWSIGQWQLIIASWALTVARHPSEVRPEDGASVDDVAEAPRLVTSVKLIALPDAFVISLQGGVWDGPTVSHGGWYQYHSKILAFLSVLKLWCLCHSLMWPQDLQRSNKFEDLKLVRVETMLPSCEPKRMTPLGRCGTCPEEPCQGHLELSVHASGHGSKLQSPLCKPLILHFGGLFCAHICTGCGPPRTSSTAQLIPQLGAHLETNRHSIGWFWRQRQQHSAGIFGQSQLPGVISIIEQWFWPW